MTTLISFLGKNTSDKQTGYRTANYHFADGKPRKVPFFGMGLLDYAKPDKLILLGTTGSMWDVFFDHQQTDDEATLALVEAVATQTVSQDMLSIHERRLAEKFGIPVQCVLISHARDENEQTTILTDLANILAPGEKIILDVTHGFRHLPMLALVAARYLSRVHGVSVEAVYYGALEMTNADTGITPVLDLSTMLNMLDWVEALSIYDDSGNYGRFSSLLQKDGMQEQHANLLSQAAYFERNGNPVQARQSLNTAYNHVREHQGPIGELFKDSLATHIDWFRRGSRADWELALADRYLQRQDYLRAITYLCEGYISRLTEQDRGDVNSHEDREAAFKDADKNQDVWLLKNLRNAMVHGVRSVSSGMNAWQIRKAKEVESLLGNQQKLDKKLRELRKQLFQ